MGLFHHESDQAQAYDTVYNKPHEAKWSHELLAGAASFEAAKAFEEHQSANGKIPSHAKAKEFLAGAIGVAIDRMVETKGLDAIDKEKAKKHAREQAEAALHSSGQY